MHARLAIPMLSREIGMLVRSFCIALLLVAEAFAQNASTTQVSIRPAVATVPATSAAWQVLDKGLGDSNPEKRRQAIAAAGSMGPTPEALKIVEHGLQDKDTLVRQTAAAELGEMNSSHAIPYLKKALDDCTEVSFTAAVSLWKLGGKDGRDIFQGVLEGELKNSPGMVTGAIRDAQHKLRNPSTLALMGVQEAAGALLGPASMGIMFAKEALKDGGSTGRVLAAKYLGEDPDPYALTLLEWALADKNWAVRAAVAKALGQRGNTDTIAKLEPLLADTHPAVSYMAAASIVRLAAAAAAPPSETVASASETR
jgi:HEAT repeat protein